jgi:hypothetical protein
MCLYLQHAEGDRRERQRRRQNAANYLAGHADRHGWTRDDLIEIAQILEISDLLPEAEPAADPVPQKRIRTKRAQPAPES